jgi:hypothetical protein
MHIEHMAQGYDRLLCLVSAAAPPRASGVGNRHTSLKRRDIPTHPGPAIGNKWKSRRPPVRRRSAVAPCPSVWRRKRSRIARKRRRPTTWRMARKTWQHSTPSTPPSMNSQHRRRPVHRCHRHHHRGPAPRSTPRAYLGCLSYSPRSCLHAPRFLGMARGRLGMARGRALHKM